MNNMSDNEAYRILTRELTNMHHSERDALDNARWRYRAALDLVKAGKNAEAIELACELVTDNGQAWRAKQDLRFIN